MDLIETIRQLYEEKEKLERAIAALEQMQANGDHSTPGVVQKKRRGRKSMGSEERLQVANRMRRYWVNRRKGRSESKGMSKAASRSDLESGIVNHPNS